MHSAQHGMQTKSSELELGIDTDVPIPFDFHSQSLAPPQKKKNCLFSKVKGEISLSFVV